MSAVERAAQIIGETWYRGGGQHLVSGPSWTVMAQALADAGLLVTENIDRQSAIDEMVADAIADFGS